MTTTYYNPTTGIWEPSAWVRDMLATLRRRADGGRLKPCRHAKNNRWVSWHPDRLYCPSCATEERLAIRGTDENWKCDRCDEVNVDDCAPFSIPVPARGALIVATFGLCTTCKAAEGVTE